jgi:hypothetical protein
MWIHHISLIDIGLSISRKQLPMTRAVIPTISTCFMYPQPISRSDVPHTSCIIGTYPHFGDREVDPVRL